MKAKTIKQAIADYQENYNKLNDLDRLRSIQLLIDGHHLNLFVKNGFRAYINH